MDDQGKETETVTAGASSTSAATPHQSPPKNNLSSPVTPSDPVEPKAESDKTPGVRKVDDEMIVDNPVIKLYIENVSSSFSVTCSLDLRHIALAEKNVEFRKGRLFMKLRKPRATASIWSTGKVICIGPTSENESTVAARRVARRLQKLGYEVKFQNFRITFVMGCCSMPFAIDLIPFNHKFSSASFLDSVKHHVLTYKIDDLKASVRVFATGYISILAPSVENVKSAMRHLFPLVKACGRIRTKEEIDAWRLRKWRSYKRKYGYDKLRLSAIKHPPDVWEKH